MGDYLVGPKVIIRVLKRRQQEGQKRSDNGSEVEMIHCWKGDMSQGMQTASRTGKRRRDPPLRPPEGMQPCQYFDFLPTQDPLFNF